MFFTIIINDDMNYIILQYYTCIKRRKQRTLMWLYYIMVSIVPVTAL